MPPAPLVEPASIDDTKVVVDLDGIRRVNPQRYEMEQLSAIIQIDLENKLVIGYKDVTAGEFWVRGHMPDYPLFPGVLMCEAAAQLASYLTMRLGIFETGSFIGYGGIEDVRFRGQVKAGDRLILVAKGVRLHRRQTIFESQGFVAGNMVFHGKIIGVPLVARGPTEGG